MECHRPLENCANGVLLDYKLGGTGDEDIPALKFRLDPSPGNNSVCLLRMDEARRNRPLSFRCLEGLDELVIRVEQALE